ncbi:MAG: glucosamine-6-phosphate deaminase [Elusimicrobia bacterium]|nr:MAG: glucosamine-6-phosphate deaminase [Elusimicrobiota bacterium]
MEIVLCRDVLDAASRCADIVEELLQEKPDAVLGLPTGTTPLPFYEELRSRSLSFARVRSFNLDEYIGLPEGHPGSYTAYMARNFDVNACSVCLPDGRAEDLEKAASAYEALIQEAGGIDLQILGIGRNGHIGFNEPGSSLKSRTRVKTLSEPTLKANASDFEGIEPPTMALTMGIGTILEARRIVLLAAGASKAIAVRDMAEGPLSANCPASALQMHEKPVVFVDPEAASQLANTEYYQRSQALQEKLKNA